MTSKRTRIGSGSPSFCWHCQRQLMRAKGKGLGLFHFDLVVDRDGIEHRVHQGCVSETIGDGVKEVKVAA